MVDALAASERTAARAAAWKTQQVYDVLKYTEANIPVVTSHGTKPWDQKRTSRQVAVSEVAAVLRIPERTAENLLEESRMLVERLPLTMAGLTAGDFSYRHAKVVVDHARSLREELHVDFEATVVPSASRLTVSKFDQKARTIRERMDASTIEARHVKSLNDRETYFEPARDGMDGCICTVLRAWPSPRTTARMRWRAPCRVRARSAPLPSFGRMSLPTYFSTVSSEIVQSFESAHQ